MTDKANVSGGLVHRHVGPGPALGQLSFMLGEFKGVGRYADGRQPFTKFVSGQLEAGGCFISLRMAAEYPLADGRVDNHCGLVIVGASPDGFCLAARAFTDGGLQHEYSVRREGAEFVFADATPDHGRHWRRARKILVPQQAGFEERLEVAMDDDVFETFYTIFMQRVGAGSP